MNQGVIWLPVIISSFEEKMKDGPISKLLITKTGYRPTQYKKINDTLPVLCADKNFQGLYEVILTKHDLVEMEFISTYPGATQWSNTYHVEIQIVDLSVAVDANTDLWSPIVTLLQKKRSLTQIFRSNYYRNKTELQDQVSRVVWEPTDNELNQSILFLMNLKNKIAKKDLRLAYSQGNNTAYPPNIEAMAKYLSTQ